MATGASGPDREPASGGRESTADDWASKRRVYLDNLKVVLIAAIIAGHGIVGYSELEFWPYSEMKEVELSSAAQTVLFVVAGPFSLLLIPLLFLTAGLLSPGSLERKGPGAYARDRLLRLGAPFALYVVLLHPLLMYPVHPPGDRPESYWGELIGSGDQFLDTGPLWFVGVLLIFSLAYAGWATTRPERPARPGSREIRAVHLLALVLAVTAATFVVRLLVPFGTPNKLLTLNVWEWPTCMALFTLGVSGSRRGWLGAVPQPLRRQCRTAVLATFAGFVVFVGGASALGVSEEQMWGGWHWAALGWAIFESALAVYGPLWLLGVAQQRLDRRIRWIGPAVSRSAYGAFVLQGVFLIGLAFALRPLPLTAEVKALIVAGGSVVGSFSLAWLLISRLPGVARIL